jgi:hypothetical protein
MLVLYVVLFVAALHNAIRYVVIGKRFGNFHITYFYVLVFLCLIARILWLSLILCVVFLNDNQETYVYFSDGMQTMIYETDHFASYIELLIGIQQTSCMYEIYLLIKSTLRSA